MFASGAGTIKLLEASREMTRWIYRLLAMIEGYLKGRGAIAALRKGGRGPTMGEIELYQFLEFTKGFSGRIWRWRQRRLRIYTVHKRGSVMRACENSMGLLECAIVRGEKGRIAAAFCAEEYDDVVGR